MVRSFTGRISTGSKVAGLAAVMLAALLMVIPSPAGADDDTDTPPEEPTSQITITQKDSGNQEGVCLPGVLGLSYQVHNASEYFELVVRSAGPRCAPIRAKAAVYAMPGNGEAWPQTLVEVEEFTISRAGTTTIRFEKTCDPQQFDVLTGATPDEISPWGEWHGPLLFPLDTNTALQHWGCEDGVTSTTEPSGNENPDETIDPDDTTVPTSVLDSNDDRDEGPDTEVDDALTADPDTSVPVEVGGVIAERGGSQISYAG